jgi:hypothetical protein
MLKFTLKSIVFLLPVLLFLLWFEHNLNNIPNIYNSKRAGLEEQLDSIEVLVLGSSQPLYGIDPAYFGVKGYNCSNVAQSLYYDYGILHNYIDKMPRLKCVIVGVSYFSFGYQIIDGSESWRDYYYSQYWHIRYPEVKWTDIRNYSKIFLYTPKKSLEYARRSFRVNLAKGVHLNGWCLRDNGGAAVTISDSLGKKRVAYHDSLYKEGRVAGNVAVFRRLIAEIRRHGARPVIITLPVFETYSKYADPKIVAQNRAIIDSVCRQERCSYRDYFTDARFTRSDFADNDHLNVAGAEKFSKIVNADVLSPF